MWVHVQMWCGKQGALGPRPRREGLINALPAVESPAGQAWTLCWVPSQLTTPLFIKFHPIHSWDHSSLDFNEGARGNGLERCQLCCQATKQLSLLLLRWRRSIKAGLDNMINTIIDCMHISIFVLAKVMQENFLCVQLTQFVNENKSPQCCTSKNALGG
jgi:hypothetical protein